MSLVRSPLYRIAAGVSCELDDYCIEALKDLVNNIERHPFRNLVGVIYYSLKRTGSIRYLPSDLNDKLKRLYLHALTIDMRQRGWLENFIEKRLPSDTPIILLKGSANWGTIYSPEGPRIGCDVDLLVRDSDFETITEIMNRIAKKVVLDETRVYTNRISYEYSYIVESYSISVEIHRRVSYPFLGNVDYESLFRQSEIHPYYKDRRVRIMRPVERLMHTLIHSIKHSDISTHEIIDSYLIIKKYGLDPHLLYSNAREYGISDYYLLFIKKVFELIGDHYQEIRINRNMIDERIFKLSERVFNILHSEVHTIGLRKRQLISLLLLDRMSDVYKFLNYYAGLRVRDFFSYKYSSLFGVLE